MNCKPTLLVLVGVLCPSVAHASINYPLEIEKLYGYPYTGDCTLCHQESPGVEGTVRRPFGRQVIDRGAAGKVTATLLDALDQMEDAGRSSDADQDGWGDIEELRQLTDPNDFYDPPYPPDPEPGSGSGGTASETGTTGGTGGNAGAGEPDPATLTSTTGRTRPRPPPSAELPPELETGCQFGAVPHPSALWAWPALLVGTVLLRRRGAPRGPAR